jgi:multidrug efflux pump subunit AcrA (membrane-fusion protein)
MIRTATLLLAAIFSAPMAAQARCVTDIRAPKSLGPVFFSFEKREKNPDDHVFLILGKKNVGDHITPADVVVVIETIAAVQVDGLGAVPAAVEVKPSSTGKLTEIVDHRGETIHPGDVVARMDCN